MVFLVTAENRVLFEADLLEMHRQRKTVFVDSAGWNVPVIAGLEMDQHDHSTTMYLLVKAPSHDELLGSARLLPTTGPHLMLNLQDGCSDVACPRGSSVWEVSRFCPSPRLYRRARLRVLWEITCAVMETALLFGIHEVIFAVNGALLPLAQNCGWQTRTLGRLGNAGHDEATVIVAAITPQGLQRVRERFDLSTPVLRFPATPRLSTRPHRCIEEISSG